MEYTIIYTKGQFEEDKKLFSRPWYGDAREHGPFVYVDMNLEELRLLLYHILDNGYMFSDWVEMLAKFISTKINPFGMAGGRQMIPRKAFDEIVYSESLSDVETGDVVIAADRFEEDLLVLVWRPEG